MITPSIHLRRRARTLLTACLCLSVGATVMSQPLPSVAAPTATAPTKSLKSLASADFAAINARDGDIGFLAEYFLTPDLKGEPAATRLESSSSFSFAQKPPIPGFQGQAYSVRWTGTVTPARSARFVFGLRGQSADARLLIDGKPLVELDANAKDFARATTGEVNLIADKSYEIVIELRSPATGTRLVGEWAAGPAIDATPAPDRLAEERVLGPAAGTVIGSAAKLQNANFQVESARDGTVTVTELATGVRATFAPEFYVASDPRPINRANGKFINSDPVGSTNYKVPAWNKETDYFVALGKRDRLRPTAVSASTDALRYDYPTSPGYSLSAQLTIPADGTEPKLTFTLKANKDSQYTVGFAGAPEQTPDRTDFIWQPLIWNGARFPNASYLSEEYQCPIPSAMMGVAGVTVGVAADPAEMPFRMPTSKNSRFGILIRNAAGNAQPVLFAPVLGGADSEMKAGSSYSFSLRLVARKGNWYAAYRHLAETLYSFADVRENGLCNLNTTIENMADFLLTPQFSYWYPEFKTWGYQNDAAGSGRQQSAADPISLALVLDDRRILNELAFPSLEYFLSRNATGIRIAGPDPRNYMGGPVPSSFVDLVAAYQLSGGRLTGLRNRLLEAFPDAGGKNGRDSIAGLKSGMNYQLARFRLSRNPEDLRKARELADKYIALRLNKPAETFSNDLGSSFWNEIGPYWDVLYELYNETGDRAYLAAATKGIQEFSGFVNLVPPIPAGNITANPGGIYNGQPVPEESVPAWRVAANGLASECAGTASSHRGVFMAPFASYFARLALDSDDSMFINIARSSTIGRYANYPSYAYRNGYSTVYEKPTYPLRPFEEIKKFTSAHYNHPLPMTAFLVDFLVAETYYRSKSRIDFPSAYTNTGAYFKNKLFGHAPGRFYEDNNVWLWLPRKLVSFDSTQVNYLAGHGNGKLYLALSNASSSPVTTTLKLSPQLVKCPTSTNVRVWVDNVASAPITLKDNQVTVVISPKGITALAIDDVKPTLDVQVASTAGAAPLPDDSYKQLSTPTGAVSAFILSFGGDLTRAYVFLNADRKQLAKATLTYTFAGTTQTITDDAYPFEFSVPLPASASDFTFKVQTTPTAGAPAESPLTTLRVR